MHPKEFIHTDTSHTTDKILNNLPYIQIYINQCPVTALIDTGAEFSLLDQKVVIENQQKFKNLLPIKSVNLLTINKKRITQSKKRCIGDVEINQIHGKMEFLIVPNLVVDCILGMDNLTRWNININTEDKTINCRDLTIKWKEEEGEQEELQVNVQDQLEINTNENIQQERNHEEITGEEAIINNIHAWQFTQTNIQIQENYKEKTCEILARYPGLSNEESRIAQGYIHKLEVNSEEPFNAKT